MIDGLLSLVFFITEVILAVVVAIKAPDTPYRRTLLVLISLLSFYQLTEFLLCIGISPEITGRIGFIVITFLPPTGLMLTLQLTDQKRPELVIYVLSAIGFSMYFMLVEDSVKLVDCNPLYAVYHYKQGYLYGFYYYLTLLISMVVLIDDLRLGKKQERELYLLLLGYLAFLLPVALMAILDPTYTNAIPSIMCKYAVILAIILVMMAFTPSTKRSEPTSFSK